MRFCIIINAPLTSIYITPASLLPFPSYRLPRLPPLPTRRSLLESLARVSLIFHRLDHPRTFLPASVTHNYLHRHHVSSLSSRVHTNTSERFTSVVTTQKSAFTKLGAFISSLPPCFRPSFSLTLHATICNRIIMAVSPPLNDIILSLQPTEYPTILPRR